jgi:hypothetical protein
MDIFSSSQYLEKSAKDSGREKRQLSFFTRRGASSRLKNLSHCQIAVKGELKWQMTLSIF